VLPTLAQQNSASKGPPILADHSVASHGEARRDGIERAPSERPNDGSGENAPRAGKDNALKNALSGLWLDHADNMVDEHGRNSTATSLILVDIGFSHFSPHAFKKQSDRG